MGRILYGAFLPRAKFRAFERVAIVCEGSGKVVVLCKNVSSLLRHASLLNELGYYSVSLCCSVAELIDLLEAGKKFRYLIFDGFDFVVDARHLEVISWSAAVGSIVAISDVNSMQRERVFRWARQYEIPLLGVLQAPLRFPELQLLMGYDDLISSALVSSNFCASEI
ncbi:hypothetical protein [Pseudomonas chlororaphis]|uniref:hypothetical protein n=1 Tax=Pseudomonas chlororaphis TaxID=587753 RepID=UPI00068432DF|nr:hypothetical protein [Pseudomonas chlororaphis]